MTLTDIQNKLGDLICDYRNHPEVYLKYLPQELKNYVISTRTVKNGESYAHKYCHECGREWDEPFSYKETACKCGNTKSREIDINRDNNVITKNYGIILDVNKEKEYIVGILVDCYYSFVTDDSIPDSDPWKVIKGCFSKPYRNPYNQAICFMYSKDKGLRLFKERDNRLLNLNSSAYTSSVCIISNVTYCDHLHNEACELFGFNKDVPFGDELYAAERDAQAKRYSNRKPRKIQSKKKKEILPDVTCHDIDLTQNTLETSLGVLKTTIGRNSIYTAGCCKCLKSSEVTIEYEDIYSPKLKYTCPHCGKETPLKVNSNSYYRDSIVTASYEKVFFDLDKNTGTMIIRFFDIDSSQGLEGDMEVSQKEKFRIYCGEKMQYYGYDGEEFKTKNPSSFSYTSLQLDELVQTPQEIKDIIKNSSLKYSGLEIMWELDTAVPFSSETYPFSSYSYLRSWYKMPWLEQIIKVGLMNLARNYISMSSSIIPDGVNPEGTTVTSILGISKPVLKISQQLNLNKNDFEMLKDLYEIDNTLTAETFVELRDANVIPYMLRLNFEFHIPLKKAIEYMHSCYDNQCIEYKESMMTWCDYLAHAVKLTYNLNNKNTKYPQSLKKEHDRAMFAYRAVEDQINREHFEEQAQKNKKYEYSYKNLFVRIPKIPEEIIDEGQQQRHCVRIYVDRVRNGDTVVGFIRKKDDPEKSYFTIEIQNDVLIQVKGYTNCPPTDKDLLEFIDHFVVAKKLKSRY